jgi:8-hydroxy-5-deazaflavin:NADPH oxidoreductase
MSSISIIGSGDMASALGTRAVKGGNAVEVIGRDAGRAAALANALGGGTTARPFGAVPAGDIVILAVPYASVVPVVAQYGMRWQARSSPRSVTPSTPRPTGWLTLKAPPSRRRSPRPPRQARRS